jgi:hypothetical protein
MNRGTGVSAAASQIEDEEEEESKPGMGRVLNFAVTVKSFIECSF